MFEKSGAVGVAGTEVQNKIRDFLRACRSSWGEVSVFITYAVNYGEPGLIKFENATGYLFEMSCFNNFGKEIILQRARRDYYKEH